MGEDVLADKDLIQKKKIVLKIWKSIYPSLLIPVGGYRKIGCKKCGANGNHSYHITPLEKRKNKIGQRLLVKIKGLFN